MAGFCLIPSEVDKFKEALTSGKIDPAKLSDMTSEDRHNFFSDIVGQDNAKGVNSLFESKLLLKNQQAGMITWAKKVAGIPQEARRDMIARIERLDAVLNPTDEKAFLHDLAETKLGVSVTPEEAKTISQMSKDIETARAGIKASSAAGSSDRMAYGHALVKMENYLLDKKGAVGKMRAVDFLKHPVKTATLAAGQTKAINASMDNSSIFRQGWKTLITNPILWQRNARRTFIDLARQFGNKEVMSEVRANIMSRDNALNGNYRKMGLDVGTTEEPFPTHLPEKIPVLGRLYRASESAYTAFVYRQRADIADKYLQIAEKSGVNLGDTKELKSIGKLVNSLTGRGALGSFERVAGSINNVFFSPRFIKSNLDTLTAHQFQKGVTPFVRKKAAMNLVKIVSATASILAIADAIKPGSVEKDPRSTDFGKIRVGDTRFDVTGGMGSIVTLASRITPTPGKEGIGEYSKNPTTKQITKLNSGKFGSETGMDVVDNFFQNKLSPVAGVARDFLKGQTIQAQKPSLGKEAAGLVLPLSAQNYQELKGDPHSANILASMIADGLGIVTNTYGQAQTNWNQNPGKELLAFKSKVGQTKFNDANQQYNKDLGDLTQKITTDPRYTGMSQSQQQALLTKVKAKVKTKVMKSYDFTYHEKRAKTTNTKQLLGSYGL